MYLGGWAYEYNDEGLEMLSVRHGKSFRSDYIEHLESFAFWSMEVGIFKAFYSYINGAHVQLVLEEMIPTAGSIPAHCNDFHPRTGEMSGLKKYLVLAHGELS